VKHFEATLSGALTDELLVAPAMPGRRVKIHRISVGADVAVDIKVHLAADDPQGGRLLNVESSNGVELYLDGQVDFDEPVYFSGGAVGENVTIVIDYEHTGRNETGSDGKLGILVPWYNHPNHYDPPNYKWPNIAQERDEHTPITAIINPSSGPGVGGPNADYVVGADLFLQSGVKMLGYVLTNYGGRLLADVKADIDEWADNWTKYVTGIFFYEIPDSSIFDLAKMNYYREVVEYARSKIPGGEIVINPGTDLDDPLAGLGDIVSSFEDTEASWTVNKAIATARKNTHLALIHTVTTETGREGMRNLVQQAFDEGYRWVYFTDDALPNPWDALPTDWSSLAEWVREANLGARS